MCFYIVNEVIVGTFVISFGEVGGGRWEMLKGGVIIKSPMKIKRNPVDPQSG